MHVFSNWIIIYVRIILVLKTDVDVAYQINRRQFFTLQCRPVGRTDVRAVCIVSYPTGNCIINILTKNFTLGLLIYI